MPGSVDVAQTDSVTNTQAFQKSTNNAAWVQVNLGGTPVAAGNPFPVTLASQTIADATTSGTISSNASLTQALQGQSAVTFQIIPTGFTGTVNFESSSDGGVTYFPVAVWPVGVTPTGALVTSIVNPASAVLYEGQVAAMSSVRARVSGYAAGSVAITIRATQSTASVVIDGPLPAGTNSIGTVAINAAVPAGTNNIGQVTVANGANAQAVKAASTAALATDPAAVVTLSPNSPLPAGANALGSITLGAAIPTGANTIGNVGLVAGAAAIGTVGVTSLPAVPAGTVASADAVASTGIQETNSGLYNGATFDRARGNVDTAALVTLTAASASGNSADQTNINGRGLQLGINITALTGTTPTLTVTIQGKDAASGQYYTLLASAAISATGFTLLTVYPGAPTTANSSAPQVLPRTWRVLYAIAGTTPAVTATIGASVIV